MKGSGLYIKRKYSKVAPKKNKIPPVRTVKKSSQLGKLTWNESQCEARVRTKTVRKVMI